MFLVEWREEEEKVGSKKGEERRELSERQKEGRKRKGKKKEGKKKQGKGDSNISNNQHLQGKAIILLWRCMPPNGASGELIT